MSPAPKPDTVVVSLHVPTKLHKWVKSQAALAGDSMEGYIVGILSQLKTIKEKSNGKK